MIEEERIHTLLFVDDEANILTALKRVFRKSNYNILTAESGEEGLEILKEEPVDLIMSDQRMPGMTGMEFLKQVKVLYPDTTRLILSGYSEVRTITSAINEGEVYRFIGKPWDDEELKITVGRSLERHDLIRQNRLLFEKVQEQNEKLRELNEDLERLVQERTRELEMSQQILYYLPFPVLGVDTENTVVYSNKAAQENTETFVPGTPVNQVFDPKIGELVEQARTSRKTCRLENHRWCNRVFDVVCKVVNPDDAQRGVTILLEEKQNAG